MHTQVCIVNKEVEGPRKLSLCLLCIMMLHTQLKSVHASSSLHVIYVCYQEIEYSYIILMNLFLCNYKYITMIAGLFIWYYIIPCETRETINISSPVDYKLVMYYKIHFFHC